MQLRYWFALNAVILLWWVNTNDAAAVSEPQRYTLVELEEMVAAVDTDHALEALLYFDNLKPTVDSAAVHKGRLMASGEWWRFE